MTISFVAIIFTVLALPSWLVITAEGLNCYSCLYLETAYHFEGTPIEDSCASGKTPLPRLSFDCSTMEYRTQPNLRGVAIGIPQNESSTIKDLQRIKPHPGAVFTCVTLTYNGRFNNLYDRLAVNGIFRGCLISFYNWTIDEQCHNGKLKNLMANVKEEEILDLLIDFSDELDENVTDTGICTCNENNCNVHSDSESSGIKLFSIKEFAYVIIIFGRMLSNIGEI